MRRAAKIDSNQNEIVTALRKIPGVSVAVTSSLGDGFVDVVCGRNGINYLLEIKDGSKSPSKRRLTPAEQKFKDQWKGQYCVVESLDDALRVIGIPL